MAKRILRRSLHRAIFWPGVVMAFSFGLVVAPSLAGSSNIGRILLYGSIIGVVGSIGLLLLLKAIEMTRGH